MYLAFYCCVQLFFLLNYFSVCDNGEITFFLSFVLLSLGAGPHPKAVSGRVISCTWWLFAVVLLACYFSSLNSSQGTDSAPLMIKGFEDLANQEVIEYGTLAGSSTLAFFKV